MKTIPINEASAAQLRFHAETIMGLEAIARSANRGQIEAKIRAVEEGITHVQVEDQPDSPAQTQAVSDTAARAVAKTAEVPKRIEDVKSKLHGLSPKQAAAHHHDPIIEILIPIESHAGGDRDVPVAVGGMQFLIKRGDWVPAPYRVFEALKLATQTVYDPKNDDSGRLTMQERDAFSYPFSTRNEPSEQEVAEWVERTANVELA